MGTAYAVWTGIGAVGTFVVGIAAFGDAATPLRMNISDAKRLRQLEEENARLKRLVGEQALDIVVLKDVISKNF